MNSFSRYFFVIFYFFFFSSRRRHTRYWRDWSSDVCSSDLPVHLSRQQSRVQCIQRLMLAAPWPEPVRKSKKVGFVDSVQHLDRRALDDFVFQRRDSERSLPPVGLSDIHSTHRLRSVRSSLQPFDKILEVSLQLLAVVPPRLPVHTGRSFLLQTEVGHAQCFQVVDVVQKRREPQLLILSCCLTYRSSALGASFRLGVRDAFCCGRFPLAKPLPSIPSAAGCPALFGDFSGTTGLSDFPGPFVIGVRPWTSRCVPRQLLPWTALGSPGSHARCLRTCTGALIARDSGSPRDIGAPDVAFRFLLQRRRPGVIVLRG